ncbi:MAG: hypothetical protein ACI88C_000046 [Acidimicrobiales bacterium]|jgi:hypothetical protein
MKTATKPHAADQGIQRAQAEEKSVKEKTNRQSHQEKLDEAEAKGVSVEDIDIANLPYIDDNGDCTCTVQLKGLGRSVIVGDPGVASIGKLSSYGDSMSIRDAADVAFAVSKAVVEWTGLKCIRNNAKLGLARGDVIPQPFDLEDAHEQAWKQYDRDLRTWQRLYVEQSRADVVNVVEVGERPVEPETELEALMLSVITTNDFQRIIMGFRYNALDSSVMSDVQGGGEGN